jgi:hypothetical protein
MSDEIKNESTEDKTNELARRELTRILADVLTVYDKTPEEAHELAKPIAARVPDNRLESESDHGRLEKSRGKQVKGEPNWPLARRALDLPDEEQ